MNDTRDWKRIANEWANECYDALRRLKDAKAPAKDIADTEAGIARCVKLATDPNSDARPT